MQGCHRQLALIRDGCCAEVAATAAFCLLQFSFLIQYKFPVAKCSKINLVFLVNISTMRNTIFYQHFDYLFFCMPLSFACNAH